MRITYSLNGKLLNFLYFLQVDQKVFLLQRVDCSYSFIAVSLIQNRMELYKVMLCSERQGFIK